MFVLYVCVRPSSHTLCYAFSLFTSPFFVSLELDVSPFLNKIMDVSFDILEIIYESWYKKLTVNRDEIVIPTSIQTTAWSFPRYEMGTLSPYL